MAETGLQEVDTYVSRHQNTVAQFITTSTIMYLCLEAEQRLGLRVSKRWWEYLRCRCLAEEEAQAGDEASITSYGIPISPVTSFRYLVRILLVADKNWPSVIRNLRKARQKWVRIMRLLSMEGADSWTVGQI